MRFPTVPCFLLFALISSPCTLPAATVSFVPKTVANPEQITTTTVADLNNDGREDLISLLTEEATGGAGVFVIRLSTGGGTYGPPKQYALPNGSAAFWPILVGDFNSDGLPDLAVSGGNDSQGDLIFMYLNEGNGNFIFHGTTSIPGGNAVAMADFNHDRLMDLAYVANGELHILFGNGKAGFTPGPVTAVNFDGGMMMVGDFDGDGKADLAWGDLTNFTTTTVLYGDNTGHFSTTYVTASEPSLFSFGDVNSDGRTDLILVSENALKQSISVYYGDANRTFTTRATIPTKHCPNSSAPYGGMPAAADIDGNGINDLVIVASDCGSGSPTSYVDVLTRNANGSYNPDQTIYTANTEYGGIAYYIPNILRADQNSKPDALIGVCSDDRCLHVNYTVLLNTTGGVLPWLLAAQYF